MLIKLFRPSTNPQVEALQVSALNRALLYDIIKHGAKGASTLDLHAEHHGNISVNVKKLIERGALIHTILQDAIDKRGIVHHRIAHRIFIGFDSSVTGV